MLLSQEIRWRPFSRTVLRNVLSCVMSYNSRRAHTSLPLTPNRSAILTHPNNCFIFIRRLRQALPKPLGGGGFKTDIRHGRVFVLGISVNIPTKAFCPPMCVLFVLSESCFDTFGRIDWVGWRLARREDGWGWPTRVPQEIPHFSCKMSTIVHHLMTYQF